MSGRRKNFSSYHNAGFNSRLATKFNAAFIVEKREPLVRHTHLGTSLLGALRRQALAVAVASYRLHRVCVVSTCDRVPSLKRRRENPMHHNVSVTPDGAGEVRVARNGQGVVSPIFGSSRRHIIRELHWDGGQHRARLAVKWRNGESVTCKLKVTSPPLAPRAYVP